MKFCASILLASVLVSAACATELSLAGEWRLALDASVSDPVAGPGAQRFLDTTRLPGSTAAQRKGPELEMELRMDQKTMNRLRERHPFIGRAWYQREVEIPADWKDKEIRLTLERVLWESRVWVDGKAVGGPQQSLSVPHHHELTGALVPGQKHTLTLCIDNREIIDIGNIGHAYTQGTQTIWNGVIGQLKLEARTRFRIENLQLASRPDGTLEIKALGHYQPGQKLTAAVRPRGGSPQAFQQIASVPASGDTVELLGRLDGAKPWSELSPALYELALTLVDASGQQIHRISRNFGFRQLTAKGRELQINGKTTFLRGNLECAIFPKTGHPDAEGPQWEKIMRTSRDYGLNHLRFHSWCPPEAAFEAADRHGIYLQVELPNWSFKMGQNPTVDAFFLAEGERILREYAHHPSFVMFSLGNELAGDLAAMDRLVGQLRAFAPELLFTSTSYAFSPRGELPGPADDFFISQQTQSGWVRGQGFLNSTFPSTDTDYAQGLSALDIPLVTHEVGQYVVYPNLAELPKYESTPLRSPAMEVIKRDLREKGMLEDAARFTRDSGKLAALLYKEDIERALRTKGLAGIQLLQLQDFPGQSTATVGLLDAFWDSKGLITPEKFRQFSSPVVPLARMRKFVWENNETFSANFELANFSEAPFASGFTVQLLGPDRNPVASHSFPVSDFPLGNGHAIGRFEAVLDSLPEATRLDLVIRSADGSVSNSWPVWVYPAEQASPTPVIHRAANEACLADLAAGRSVLLLPMPNTVKRAIPARFIPVFWSPLHFPNQPGTLGATIDDSHPLWNQFPTESHTDWQWWELTADSVAVDLAGLDRQISKPFCFVDKYDRNALPAAIFEAKVGPGKLLVCTLDATSDPAGRIVARQLFRALNAYLASGDFEPQGVLAPSELAGLFRPSGFTVSASSSHQDYPPSNAVDGDPKTIWHSDWADPRKGKPFTYSLDFQSPVLLAGLRLANRADSPNGRIKQFRNEISHDGERWTRFGKSFSLPNDGIPTEIRFEKPVKARHLRIITVSVHSSEPHSSLAEIEPIPAAADDVRNLGIIPGFND